jgi:hypothetical protein
MASADLVALLDVQGHDSAIATLRHLRGHLPQAVARSDAERRSSALRTEVASVRAVLDGVVARQDELEHTIRDHDARIAELERRLYGGTVSSPKDLQAIEHDLVSLRAHRSAQEDAELEVLLEREPLDERVAELTGELDALGSEVTVLDAEIATEQARIDAEVAAHGAARSGAVAALPADLVTTYERVRAANRGIGIARLEHGTCMACRLKLPAVDLDRIRQAAPDATPQCPECNALLVR